DEENDDADDQESHTGPPSGMTTLTGAGDRATVQSCTTDVRSRRSCTAALRVLSAAHARLSTPNVVQITARPAARITPTRPPVSRTTRKPNSALPTVRPEVVHAATRYTTATTGKAAASNIAPTRGSSNAVPPTR